MNYLKVIDKDKLLDVLREYLCCERLERELNI